MTLTEPDLTAWQRAESLVNFDSALSQPLAPLMTTEQINVDAYNGRRKGGGRGGGGGEGGFVWGWEWEIFLTQITLGDFLSITTQGRKYSISFNDVCAHTCVCVHVCARTPLNDMLYTCICTHTYRYIQYMNIHVHEPAHIHTPRLAHTYAHNMHYAN